MGGYRHTVEEAERFRKHGVDLTVYGRHDPSATVVRVTVERGHFQEFLNVRSSYTYYIVSGHGFFHLDDEVVEAGATDLVAVPPNTRIHYFGTMEMVLTVAPAFDERDERHIRFVDEDEPADRRSRDARGRAARG
ncbi:cupin domain-containing protein [Kitasatospora purpeofusca]|uniref:cupin domain-containing protein n=1 Tax=Kitasatospora purpeofusca TaxID=67352 RepID=UPI002A5A1392|nr:cupin domain-containing protein [Kitasatospora purpeofusca]MDY0810598.1 cupin domain-containing protein [Kitasatospora purpeofusca]